MNTLLSKIKLNKFLTTFLALILSTSMIYPAIVSAEETENITMNVGQKTKISEDLNGYIESYDYEITSSNPENVISISNKKFGWSKVSVDVKANKAGKATIELVKNGSWSTTTVKTFNITVNDPKPTPQPEVPSGSQEAYFYIGIPGLNQPDNYKGNGDDYWNGWGMGTVNLDKTAAQNPNKVITTNTDECLSIIGEGFPTEVPPTLYNPVSRHNYTYCQNEPCGPTADQPQKYEYKLKVKSISSAPGANKGANGKFTPVTYPTYHVDFVAELYDTDFITVSFAVLNPGADLTNNIATSQHEIDTSFNDITVPEAESIGGYIFDGWYTDMTWEESKKVDFSSTDKIGKTVTYYGHYLKEFNLTNETYDFVYNGQEQGNAFTGVPEGSKVEYKVNDQWTETLPMVKDANEYTFDVCVSAPGYVTETAKLTYNVSQRNLKISANDYTHTYDGNPYTLTNYSIADNENEGLVNSDKLTGLIVGSVTETDVNGENKTYTIELGTPKVTTTEGADVTTNYNIELVKGTGTLTIVPREVNVSISGAKKEVPYNEGNLIKIDGFTYSSNDEVFNREDVEKDFVQLKEGKSAHAEGRNVNNYPMGLTTTDFECKNSNYIVTYTVNDGLLIITANNDINQLSHTLEGYNGYYDGKPHGLKIEVGDPENTEILIIDDTGKTVYEGKAEDLLLPSFTDAVSHYYEVYISNSNYGEEVIQEDLVLEIKPLPINLTITGEKINETYDAKEHSAVVLEPVIAIGDIPNKEAHEGLFDLSKYATYNGEVFNKDDFKLTSIDVVDLKMDIDKDLFEFNDNFDVNTTVDNGSLTITKASSDKVQVKAENASGTYKNAPYSPEVTVTSLLENDKTEFTIEYSHDGQTTTETPQRVDATVNEAGEVTPIKYDVVIKSKNFEDINVEGGVSITVEPADLKVKVIANKVDNAEYTGKEQSVQGIYDYEYTDSIGKFNDENIVFDAEKAIAKRTECGTEFMGLKASDFSNNNPNYNVTFDVDDGYLTIVPSKEGKISFTPNNYEGTYDGQAHEVSVSVSEEVKGQTKVEYLIDGNWAETKPTYTNATTALDGGKHVVKVRLSNQNYKELTETEVYFDIAKATVNVTVTGDSATKVYTGEEQSVEGFKAESSNPLFNEKDIKLKENCFAKATGTNVGEHTMNLSAEMFVEGNENLIFNYTIKDGKLTINPLALSELKYTANSYDGNYDGKPHSVSVKLTNSYDVANTTITYYDGDTKLEELPSEKDFTNGPKTFNVTIENPNYVDENGSHVINTTIQINIKKLPVNVTITGNSDTKDYTGEEQSVEGYSVTSTNELFMSEYNSNLVAVNLVTGKTAKVSGTDANTYAMVLTADMFDKDQKNYDVTYTTFNGQLVINPVRGIELTVEDVEKVYSGDPYKLTPSSNHTDSFLYSIDNGENWLAVCPSVINANVNTYDENGLTIKVKTNNPNYINVEKVAHIKVMPKAVTITAPTLSVEFGKSIPELNESIEGTVKVEDNALIQSKYQITRVAGENVGDHEIYFTDNEGNKLTSERFGNYNVTFVNGNLNIYNSDELTISTKSYEVSYDGNNHYPEVKASINGQELSDDEVTIRYKYKTAANGWTDWSLDKPSIKNAGELVFQAEASKDGYNVAKTAETKITVSSLKVDFKSQDCEGIHDGSDSYGFTNNKPLIVTVGNDTNTFPKGEGYEFEFTAKLNDVNSVNNTFNIALTNANAANYIISKDENAKLTVKANITYDGNGNTSGSVPLNTTAYANGQTIALVEPEANFGRTDAIFVGWSLEKHDVLKTIDELNNVNIIKNTLQGLKPITVYAVWVEDAKGSEDGGSDGHYDMYQRFFTYVSEDAGKGTLTGVVNETFTFTDADGNYVEPYAIKPIHDVVVNGINDNTFDYWTNSISEDKDFEEGFGKFDQEYTEDVTFTAHFDLDLQGDEDKNNAPDGIADKYQVVFTYLSTDSRGKLNGADTVYETFTNESKDDQGHLVYSETKSFSPKAIPSITTSENTAFDYWQLVTDNGPKDFTRTMDTLKDAKYSQDTSFKAYFDDDFKGDEKNDNKPDGIADKYQVVFTYKTADKTTGLVNDKELIYETFTNKVGNEYQEITTAVSPKLDVLAKGNAKENYVFDYWTNSVDDSKDFSANMSKFKTNGYKEDVTFTAYFDKDLIGKEDKNNGPDGIADKYQTVFTYVTATKDNSLGTLNEKGDVKLYETHTFIKNDEYILAKEMPVKPTTTFDPKAKAGNAFDHWNNGEKNDYTKNMDELRVPYNSNQEFVLNFSADTKGDKDNGKSDGIADAYQIMFTYEVENSKMGTLNNGIKDADVFYETITTIGESPKATPTVKNVKAYEGYAFDVWTNGTLSTNDIKMQEFIKEYTKDQVFTAKFDKDLIGDEDKNNGPDGIADKYQTVFTYKVDDNDHATLNGKDIVYETHTFTKDGKYVLAKDVKVSPKADVVLKAKDNFAFINWSNGDELDFNMNMQDFKKNEYNTNQTFVANFGSDIKGNEKDGKSDNIPDEYQIMFTYQTEDTTKGLVNNTDVVYETHTSIVDGKYAPIKNVVPEKAITVKANSNYAFDYWTNSINKETDLDANMKNLRVPYNKDVTFTATFDKDIKGDKEDGKSDNIPDKYQIMFTYKTSDSNKGLVNDELAVYETITNMTDKKLSAVPSLELEVNAKQNYAFDYWMNGEVKDFDKNMTNLRKSYTEDQEFVVYFDEDMTGSKEDPTKPDGTPDKYQAKVEYKVIDGTSDIEETYVNLVDENGNLAIDGTALLDATQIPTIKANKGFVLGTWDVEPTITTVISKDTTFTHTCDKDEFSVDPNNPDGSDGIADKYQVRVDFKANNGTVSHDYAYVTLFNELGYPAIDGVGHLGKAQIPTTQANAGYHNPTWNVQPTTTTEITENTTFTVSYTAIPVAPADPDETPDYPYVPEEVVTPEVQPEVQEVEKEDVKPEVTPSQPTIIDDPDTPEVGDAAWAVLNLIAAVATVVLAILLLISKSKKDYDDDEEDAKRDEDAETSKLGRNKLYKVLSVVTAIIAVVLFFLTEDMSLPMAIVDKWSIVMVVILVISIVEFYLGRRWHNPNDDDEEEVEA